MTFRNYIRNQAMDKLASYKVAGWLERSGANAFKAKARVANSKIGRSLYTKGTQEEALIQKLKDYHRHAGFKNQAEYALTPKEKQTISLIKQKYGLSTKELVDLHTVNRMNKGDKSSFFRANLARKGNQPYKDLFSSGEFNQAVGPKNLDRPMGEKNFPRTLNTSKENLMLGGSKIPAPKDGRALTTAAIPRTAGGGTFVEQPAPGFASTHASNMNTYTKSMQAHQEKMNSAVDRTLAHLKNIPQYKNMPEGELRTLARNHVNEQAQFRGINPPTKPIHPIQTAASDEKYFGEKSIRRGQIQQNRRDFREAIGMPVVFRNSDGQIQYTANSVGPAGSNMGFNRYNNALSRVSNKENKLLKAVNESGADSSMRNAISSGFDKQRNKLYKKFKVSPLEESGYKDYSSGWD
jgi:hypothetical protein